MPVIRSAGAGDTVSLGGGIRYADLKLRKSGNDLVLDVGQGEHLSFDNWYRQGSQGRVAKLQVVTLGGDYAAGSTDKLLNRQVGVFDFTKLVAKFDAARALPGSNAAGWAVMNSLLDAHLQGSDSSALGGDLAFQYATTGSFSGIGLGAAQGALAAGTDWQTLKARSELEQGSVRLS